MSCLQVAIKFLRRLEVSFPPIAAMPCTPGLLQHCSCSAQKYLLEVWTCEQPGHPATLQRLLPNMQLPRLQHFTLTCAAFNKVGRENCKPSMTWQRDFAGQDDKKCGERAHESFSAHTPAHRAILRVLSNGEAPGNCDGVCSRRLALWPCHCQVRLWCFDTAPQSPCYKDLHRSACSLTSAIDRSPGSICPVCALPECCISQSSTAAE